MVAARQARAQTVTALSTLPGEPLLLRLLPNTAAAQVQARDRSLAGVLVVNPDCTRDTLYVATAAGPSTAAATVNVIGSAERAQGRTIAAQDLVPVSPRDSGGLATFYLAVGWTVTGYLIAAMLGVSAGTRPATVARAVIRHDRGPGRRGAAAAGRAFAADRPAGRARGLTPTGPRPR